MLLFSTLLEINDTMTKDSFIQLFWSGIRAVLMKKI